MEKKCILINAIHPEENRVAIVDHGYLQELEVEAADKVQAKSNIYKGIITRVEPSLQAAFVEYGSAKQGFLPLNEIHSGYWKAGSDTDADPRKVHIQDVVEGRQHILVQVVKEERGNKGAALTTFISLAGRYLVLSPNTARVGISRKLNEEDRRTVRQLIEKLEVPSDMGLIVRTAGKDQELESLQRDFSYLMRLWEEIRMKADGAKVPSFIYLDGDLATRTIRDHFSDDIEEIWVDQYELYQRTKQFVHAVLPGKEKIVKLYRDKVPLFTKYKIEDQCAEIYAREINMPSGAQLVFDPTEALTSIDINSGRSTSAKHIDDTALETNLESAREIARQLRIRDIGGLIVIDFIDMSSRKHAQLVEEELRKSCKGDKARIQFARISRFGLLEMSRQRLHLSIRESTSEVCPRCQGMGSIRTVESVALHLLIRIDEEAKDLKDGDILHVLMAAEAVDYLSNHKRQNLLHIEEIYKRPVYLQSRVEIHNPHYRIERHWQDESGQARIEVLEDTAKSKKPVRSRKKFKSIQKPIVGVPKFDEAVVVQKTVEPKSLWQKLLGMFSESSEDKVSVSQAKSEETPKKNTQPIKEAEQAKAQTESQSEASTTRRRRRRRRTPRRDGAETNHDQTQVTSNNTSNEAKVEDSSNNKTSVTKQQPEKVQKEQKTTVEQPSQGSQAKKNAEGVKKEQPEKAAKPQVAKSGQEKQGSQAKKNAEGVRKEQPKKTAKPQVAKSGQEKQGSQAKKNAEGVKKEQPEKAAKPQVAKSGQEKQGSQAKKNAEGVKKEQPEKAAKPQVAKSGQEKQGSQAKKNNEGVKKEQQEKAAKPQVAKSDQEKNKTSMKKQRPLKKTESQAKATEETVTP